MNEAYLILSKIYEALAADSTLDGLVQGIYVQAQAPKGAKHPVLLFWIRDAAESRQVHKLSGVMFDFVIRATGPEGEGTQIAQIFARVDALVNETVFKKTSASGKLVRSGLPVRPALYDEVQRDYFKHWSYRAIVKNVPTS